MRNIKIILAFLLIIFPSKVFIEEYDESFGEEFGAYLTVYVLFLIVAFSLLYSTQSDRIKSDRQKERQYEEEAKRREEISKKQESLRHLKREGLLTAEEYTDKAGKLNHTSLQIRLQKTKEYKHLVSLKNGDILTQDEYENKIEALKQKIKKEKNFNENSEKYNQIGDFVEGLARIWDEDQYYGFINKEKLLVIDTKYEYAEDFSEDLALVRMNGKFGYINKKDHIIIPFKFKEGKGFKNGEAEVFYEKERHIIDKEGNILR